MDFKVRSGLAEDSQHKSKDHLNSASKTRFIRTAKENTSPEAVRLPL